MCAHKMTLELPTSGTMPFTEHEDCIHPQCHLCSGANDLLVVSCGAIGFGRDTFGLVFDETWVIGEASFLLDYKFSERLKLILVVSSLCQRCRHIGRLYRTSWSASPLRGLEMGLRNS